MLSYICICESHHWIAHCLYHWWCCK